jgi:lipoprotein-anchoring transpeptidase ErfK/SrfK
MMMLSRRPLLVALAATLTACARPEIELASAPAELVMPQMTDPRYPALADEPFSIAALDVGGINPELLRQMVSVSFREPPGTIVVDPKARFLYLVQEDRQALRYGVGVGREGLEWSGRAVIARKASWPRWTPTARMIAREPRNARWANGMPPGLENPLGARALYLYRNGVDTMYRLHGTNEPDSIGHAVSSGCIRLFNHDIIDLHRRVQLGASVLVLGDGINLAV